MGIGLYRGYIYIYDTVGGIGFLRKGGCSTGNEGPVYYIYSYRNIYKLVVLLIVMEVKSWVKDYQDAKRLSLEREKRASLSMAKFFEKVSADKCQRKLI